MENEQILSALTQLLEEQKQNTIQHGKSNIALQNIDACINKVESSLKNTKDLSSDSGIERLQEDLIKIQKQLSEMPKSVIHQKRYLLFPEHNLKDYCSIIFKWLLYMLIATYVYYLLRFLIECLR